MSEINDIDDPKDGSAPWHFKLDDSRTYLQELVWYIDKRLFSWKGIPSLGNLPIIQRSYVFLFLIPLIDQFLSPIIYLSGNQYIVFSFDWAKIIPGNTSVSPVDNSIRFELAMPFSWLVIYAVTFSTGIGTILYQMGKPTALKEQRLDFESEHIKVEFRNVALNLFSSRRQIHFMNLFLKECAENYDRLCDIEPERIIKAKQNGNILTSFLDSGAGERINKYSIYYIANRMILHKTEDKLKKANYLINWFANETNAALRWVCGSFYLISITLTILLIAQGIVRMVQ